MPCYGALSKFLLIQYVYTKKLISEKKLIRKKILLICNIISSKQYNVINKRQQKFILQTIYFTLPIYTLITLVI